MTIEDMEYYFENTSIGTYMEWAEFKRCATFRPTNTYRTCEDKLQNVLSCFDSHTDNAWWYFEAIYEDLPTQHIPRLLLEVVYQSYRVSYTRMLGCICECIGMETPAMKKQRIEENKRRLKRYINEDGTITLYRGIGEGSLLPEYAVSYTVDKAVAEFFTENHKLVHESKFSGIYSRTVSIDKVLFYSNLRKEKEVFIIPDKLKELACEDEDNISQYTLGLHNFEEYFPTEYAKFAAEHDVTQELESM